MIEMRQITWREVTGNRYSRGLYPSMVSPNKFYKQAQIRRIGDVNKSTFIIEYDKDYLLAWLNSKVCKPLGALGCERIVELLKEAYEFNYKESSFS